MINGLSIKDMEFGYGATFAGFSSTSTSTSTPLPLTSCSLDDSTSFTFLSKHDSLALIPQILFCISLSIDS